jgi:hypothetical protein
MLPHVALILLFPKSYSLSCSCSCSNSFFKQQRRSCGLNGTKISGIWDTSSPQRQRGREDSARGFNPGNPVPRHRALKLKGRQMERAKQPKNRGRRHAKRGSISRPSGRTICLNGSPGLKPCAESCSPSGAMNPPKSSLT